MKIEIIIPIFNEEENIQILTDKISESLETLSHEYLIIFRRIDYIGRNYTRVV